MYKQYQVKDQPNKDIPMKHRQPWLFQKAGRMGIGWLMA